MHRKRMKRRRVTSALLNIKAERPSSGSAYRNYEIHYVIIIIIAFIFRVLNLKKNIFHFNTSSLKSPSISRSISEIISCSADLMFSCVISAWLGRGVSTWFAKLSLDVVVSSFGFSVSPLEAAGESVLTSFCCSSTGCWIVKCNVD